MSTAPPGSTRDLAEIFFGYSLIMLIIWLPERAQAVLSPVALIATLTVVLLRRPTLDELGLGRRGLLASLWIFPVAVAVTILSVLLAGKIGTLHPLSDANASHVAAYILWTVYQQFLLQDYFLPRLLRLLPGKVAAVSLAAVLFATAHLPNLALTAATIVWGAVACTLFLRMRNLYVLGIVQGLLGLCFAVCVPDALHHHMRVGLGYLHYRARLVP